MRSSREERTVGAGVAVGSGGDACVAPVLAHGRVLAVGEASLPTSLPHHPRPYEDNVPFD
jgi:hypothetical protein